ncbi:MAG TPA: YjgN family protein [Oxalicibacterium sp.]|nr:YjgN family protein [Oxalicibacterium sp.]
MEHLQTAAEPATSSPQAAPFVFTGSGREYFGIWIVNLLLSIVTLGIYSAWAKVRRTKYFYTNAQVAGASFDYHGNPIAILKGRFVALMLIIMYQLAIRESGVIALLMLVAVAFASPWLIWKSLQFKLYNSSYRGIRFGFRGTLRAVYKVYLLFPALSMLTLFLLSPFVHQRLKQFQHSESRFGTTHFSFSASVGKFYKVYLLAFVVWLAGVTAISIVFGGSLGALGALKNPKASGAVLSGLLTYLFALYVWLFLLFPIFNTMVQNLIWNHTQLGPHRFRCEMKWTRVVFIALTNILGVICTLGLFTPFAQIRMLRYRIGSMTLLPESPLDEFVAATQAETSATGEGVADLLDFDLSL